MVAALGALVVKIRAMGIMKTISQMKIFQTQVDKTGKEVDSQFTKITKTFSKFGMIAGGVFASMIAASPLLRARMEILALRISELVRVFGDALAPVIEFVTDLIKGLTDWFFSLDKPVQDAIVFGGAFVVVLGLLAIAFGVLSAAMSPVTLVILALAAVAAILYLAWTTNFLGLRDIVAAVFAYIGIVIDGWIAVFKGWMNTVKSIIQNVIGIFEGVLNFFKAIFAGDLQGAIDAIQDIFKNAFEAVASYILWPLTAIGELIKGMTGSRFIDDMMKAGKAFIDAFIKGVQQAIAEAAGVVEDLLNFLGDFFGGSLPERGPLKHVISWGQDFGKAYVGGITEGISDSSTHINRSLRIERLEMNVDGGEVGSSDRLFGQLNKLRTTRTW